MKIHANVLKVDIANQNALSNEVVVHFDMLCTRVEHRILSQIDTAHIVAEKGNQILDGNVHILQNPLEPYDFTCSHGRTPVFDLCAPKCNS